MKQRTWTTDEKSAIARELKFLAIVTGILLSVFIFRYQLSSIMFIGYIGGVIYVITGLLTGERKPNELSLPFLSIFNKAFYSLSLYGVLGVIFCVYLFNLLNLVLKSDNIVLIIVSVISLMFSCFPNFYVRWLLKNIPTNISYKKVIVSRYSILIITSFIGSGILIGFVFFRYFNNYSDFLKGLDYIPIYLYIFSSIYVLINIGIEIELQSKKINLTNKDKISTGKEKILLIGLDAADWRILSPLIKKGKLPNIKGLMNKGAYGYLDCYGKTYTPVVWTSIVTGVGPDKHGIKSFLFSKEGKEEAEPYKSYHRQVPALWNLANTFGKTVGIINWMITYPAERVKGFMISGFSFLNKAQRKRVIFPETKKKDFFDCLKKDNLNISKGTHEKIEEKWLQEAREENRILTCLIEKFFPEGLEELTAIYSHAPDAIQHYFWKYRLPKKFSPQKWNYDPGNIESYKNVIDDHWIDVDRMIGCIMKKIDNNTTVFIVSDHGSKPSAIPLVYLDLNKLLSKMGYLKFKENSIDFSKTTAYWKNAIIWDSTMKVSFNIKGREGMGIIEKKDLNKIRNTLIRDFNRINKKRKIFSNFKIRNKNGVDLEFEQILSTRNHGSGIEIEINNKKYPLDMFLKGVEKNSGRHAPRGIVIISGNNNNIKRTILSAKTFNTSLDTIFTYMNGCSGTKKVEFAIKALQRIGIMDPYTTLDIAPTILYLQGLPVPIYMEGKIMTKALNKDFICRNSLFSIEEFDFSHQIEEEFKDHDKEIKQKLQGLGYID